MKTRLCLSVLFLLMLVTPGDAKDPEVDVVTLQAENRMLKAQVASLKKKLEAGKIPIKVEPTAKPKTPLQKIEKIFVEDDPSWWKDVSKFDLQIKLRIAVEDHVPTAGFGPWVKRNTNFSGEKIDWKISRLLRFTEPKRLSRESANLRKAKTENTLKLCRDSLFRLNARRNDPKVSPTYAYEKAWREQKIKQLEQDVSFFERVMAKNRDVEIKYAACGGIAVRTIKTGDKTKNPRESKAAGEPHVIGEIVSIERYIDFDNETLYGLGIHTIVDVAGQVVYKR